MAGGWGVYGNYGVRIGAFWTSTELSSDGSKARIVGGVVRISRDQSITVSDMDVTAGGTAVTDSTASGININGSGQKDLLSVTGRWVTLKYGETTPAQFVAALFYRIYDDGAWWNETCSVTQTVTFPARAYSKPAPVTAVTATRNSDTSHKVEWTNHPTTGAPYVDLVVERCTYTSAGWGAWATVATVAGTATSWTDAGTIADRQYTWRVRARNTAGDSATVQSVGYGTTPAAPTALTATWVSDTQATLAWTRNTTIPGATSVEIQRWDNVGATWATIATIGGAAVTYTATGQVADRRYQFRVRAKSNTPTAVYSAGWATSGYMVTTPAACTGITATKTGSTITVSWTIKASYVTAISIEHAIAGVWQPAESLSATATSKTYTSVDMAVTHQFRVRAYNGRYSGYATSAVVSLLAAPLAPTVTVAPAVLEPTATDLVVAWVHRPVDSTPQTSYKVRYSVLGAGAWTELTGTTAVSRTIPAGTLAAGQTYEVQVCTKGDHASFGDWSASTLVQALAAPAVTITAPTGPTLASSRLTATWAYLDPQGAPQAAWLATLLDDSSTIIEQHAGTGPTSTVDFDAALADATEYTVTVAAESGYGLWSSVASVTVTTALVYPPAPTMDLIYHPDTADVDISVTTPEPGVGQAAAVRVEVYRDGQLIGVIDPSGSLRDPVPPLNVNLTYTALAWAEPPVATASDPVTISTPSPSWVLLNAGDGYATQARLKANPSVSETVDRARVLHTFAGDTRPTEYIGDEITRTYRVSGEVDGYGQNPDLGGWAPFEQIAIMPAPVCYRDPMRRVIGSISDVSIRHDATSPRAAVSFTLTEVGDDAL